jgi:hypothetical protein
MHGANAVGEKIVVYATEEVEETAWPVSIAKSNGNLVAVAGIAQNSTKNAATIYPNMYRAWWHKI